MAISTQSGAVSARSDLPPFALGVCSWSLQASSVAELKRLLDGLGVAAAQIACGDPHHASWIEGDDMPAAAVASGIKFSGAMLGFAGEDYTSPATIKATGGFGDPATRGARIERLKWGLARTCELMLTDLTLHAGFIPEPGSRDRKSFLDTLSLAGELAAEQGITLAFETGQEPASLLKTTLDELKCPNIQVNFDPANMLLYNMGDPIAAVELLAGSIRSVHVKDAIRPRVSGAWGEEVPLGRGEVDIAKFVATLKSTGYAGPLIVEREVGDQAARIRDIALGLEFLGRILSS